MIVTSEGIRTALAAVLLAGCALAAQAAEPSRKPGTVFRDCPDCPQMVVVPPGKFVQGEEGGEPERYEGKPHEVRIGYAFAVGRFEVTNGQYAAFVKATGRKPAMGCNALKDKTYAPLPGTSWADPGYGRPIRDDEPVACLRWNDASAYAAWLAGKTGKKYRLLSESEWEYAARAGTSTRFTWGSDPTQSCKYANVDDKAQEAADKEPVPYARAPCNDGYAGPSPVGKFAPNAFGLYDMIGNVWEWIEDCYAMPYPDLPNDGSPNLSKGCDRRGSKGGSWRTNIERQRPAFRGRDPEALTSQIFGMRVARDLD
jgi:formylglycine-generating enzyme required for sulfatase activity